MSKKLDEMISSLPSDRQARIQKRTMTLIALTTSQQTNHSPQAPTAPAVVITPLGADGAHQQPTDAAQEQRFDIG